MTYDDYINGKQPSNSSSNRAEMSSSSESDNTDNGDGWANEASQLVARLQQCADCSTSKDISEYLQGATDFMSSQMAQQIATFLKSLQDSGTLADMSSAKLYDLILGQATKAGEQAAQDYETQTEAQTDDTTTDDTEYDCVIMSPIPMKYNAETPMNLQTGICGYKFQINNVNKEFGFSINILKDSGFFALSAGSALLASALAFF
jgi:hypothetical protein